MIGINYHKQNTKNKNNRYMRERKGRYYGNVKSK